MPGPSQAKNKSIHGWPEDTPQIGDTETRFHRGRSGDLELAQPGAQSWNWWSLKPSADSPNMVTPKPAVVQLFFPLTMLG